MGKSTERERCKIKALGRGRRIDMTASEYVAYIADTEPIDVVREEMIL